MIADDTAPLTPFATLLSTFERAYQAFDRSPAVQFLRSGDFGRHHYLAALREFYFYTRDNPQLQASMTLHFRGTRRAAIKRVLGHAISEVGHDQLALADMRSLGADTSHIEHQHPLPSTMPMLAFPQWQLTCDNPIGYLGHVFFLEFLPTRGGADYLAALQRAGIPVAATTFLAEHATVDEQHNRLMESHVRDLVLDEHDLAACQRAIETCGHLYAHMLDGAFRSVKI